MARELVCPKCKGTNISVQIVSDTHTKKHGVAYWLLFGWLISLITWFALFIPRLIMRIIRGKKVETTHTKQAVCQNCGYSWRP